MPSSPLLLRLSFTTLAARPIRAALTAMAIALSVSLVVAVTSGYASVESAALAYLNRYLGRADAQITRPGEITDGPVPEQLYVQLATDPAIPRVTERLEVHADLIDKDGQPVSKSVFRVTGLQRPQDSRIDSLVMEKGDWFDTSVGDFAVVDQVAAAALKVDVGDTFWIAADQGRYPLKVVGIIHKPEILATAVKTVYMPLVSLQHLQHMDSPEPMVSQIAIDFQPGADLDAFAKNWNEILDDRDQAEAKLAGHAVPPIRLRMVREDRTTMDLNLRSVHVLSYLGDAVSMLAATFIIFSSLAMGVTERQRLLAILRAIGATKGQLVQLV